MPLERERFTVYLNPLDDGPPRELSVTISHQDMMRAELELSRGGVPDAAKLNLVTAWCWASLVRQGEYAGPWDRFRDLDCAGLEDAGTETVDPSQLATPSLSP